ncbi:hypothetical protein ACJX0J_015662, partial [Zea mays]
MEGKFVILYKYYKNAQLPCRYLEISCIGIFPILIFSFQPLSMFANLMFYDFFVFFDLVQIIPYFLLLKHEHWGQYQTLRARDGGRLINNWSESIAVDRLAPA